MKKILVLLVAVSVLAGGGYYYWRKIGIYARESVPAAISLQSIAQNEIPETEEVHLLPSESSTDNVTETKEVVVVIPDELNLDVPFYSQAPFGDWDYPWQEACEEASVLLAANAYFEHSWSKEEFRDEILKIVDWENKRFGDYEHTDVDQTAAMLKEYLDLQSIIHENPSLEDLKKMLAQGHLVVITFAGKELGNPFYTNGGPVYHAMLLKGYKEGEKLIFHDVGTRRGEDYVYSWDVIFAAMRDYAEPISAGEKRVIEVLPPSVN